MKHQVDETGNSVDITDFFAQKSYKRIFSVTQTLNFDITFYLFV